MNVAYNMDCMEAMEGMKDNEFDLAIVDPPYSIGASKPTKKPNFVKQKNGKFLYVNSNKYKQKNWDDKPPSKVYFEELKRVSKKQIIWGGNYFGLKGGGLIWDKLNGSSDQSDCEIAHISFSKRVDRVYYLWQGMFQGLNCSKDINKALIQIGNKQLNEVRIHPTQKPIKLYKWLLTNYAKQGDKILDTHLGSGSSRIACYDLGFDFVGYELDKEYFEAQEKRFERHINQQGMFDDITQK